MHEGVELHRFTSVPINRYGGEDDILVDSGSIAQMASCPIIHIIYIIRTLGVGHYSVAGVVGEGVEVVLQGVYREQQVVHLVLLVLALAWR